MYTNLDISQPHHNLPFCLSNLNNLKINYLKPDDDGLKLITKTEQ
jgi:hypothetical protein